MIGTKKWGYPDGSFKPNGKNQQLDEKDITEDADVFSDVQKNSWYYAAVLTCKLKKIINGYPDGTFKPGNYASRAEAFALLANYKKLPVQLMTWFHRLQTLAHRLYHLPV